MMDSLIFIVKRYTCEYDKLKEEEDCFYEWDDECDERKINSEAIFMGNVIISDAEVDSQKYNL